MAGFVPDVGVNFKVTGADQVNRALKLVKDQAEPTGRQWGSASRQIASGLESIARQGKLTGEGMKQILTQGADMAFMFGSAGAVVGALAITGAAIYEHLVGNMKKAREEARQFQTEIANLQRAGNMTGAGELAQRYYSGDRYAVQQEGESDQTYRARQMGVTGIRAEIGRLQGVVTQGIGPHGEQLESSKAAQREISEWNQILPEFERKATQAAAAANLLMAQFGQQAVNGAKIARDAAIKPENTLRYGTLSTDVFERMGFGVSGNVATPHLDAGMAKGAKGLFGSSSPATLAVVDGMKNVAEIAGRGFVDTIADTIEAGFSRIFQKGANIGTVFAAVAESALAGLGSVATQIGRAALTQFAFISTISKAIALLNPAIGIPAAIALIAFGSALGGAGHRIGANAAGGGGYGGGYSSSNGYGAAIIDRGIIDPTRGPTSRSSGNTFNFFGHRDPVVIRQFEEMLDQIDRRGRA